MDAFGVVVVGGGPGGATAASFLGRAGVRTLLVDKARFPRDKACGDAICARSVSVLRELGLEAELARAPFHRADGEVFLNRRGERLHLPFACERGHFAALPDGPGRLPVRRLTGRDDLELTPAYVVPRTVFDALLFEHARSHASVTALEGFRCESLLFEDGRVRGIEAVGEGGARRRIRAEVVIGADGAMSTVAAQVQAYDFHHKQHAHWIAAFRIYFEGIGGLGEELEIHFLEELLPGYLWIFPEGNGRANVGAGMVESFARGERGRAKVNLRQVGYRLLREHPRLKRRFANARELPNSFLGWQLPCGSERRRIAGPGWMLVGDAASLIDPFSGEGIANAMTSAQLAAQAAVRALRDGGPERCQGYADAVWDVLGEELATSTKLQKLARNKWLVDWVIHRAATRKSVHALLFDVIAHREKARQLTHPLFYVKLLAR